MLRPAYLAMDSRLRGNERRREAIQLRRSDKPGRRPHCAGMSGDETNKPEQSPLVPAKAGTQGQDAEARVFGPGFPLARERVETRRTSQNITARPRESGDPGQD